MINMMEDFGTASEDDETADEGKKIICNSEELTDDIGEVDEIKSYDGTKLYYHNTM